MILKNNKKGFTLVEMLAVVAILALFAAFAMPNFIGVFTENFDKTMQIQENNLVDAAKMYVQDVCLDRIDTSVTCAIDSSTYKKKSTSGFTYFNVQNKTFTLAKIKSAGYIDAIKTHNGVDCDGYVKITGNSATGEMTYKAYLSCGDAYKTEGY